MSLPRRSQSALEYMMTYGWAIVVIVIVAGVLYSLGIFSPASSLSSTVTGFSNLGSVTGECTANGVLRISLGDSTGYPINITSVTAKSSTGQISTFKPNSTVDPNPIIQPTSSYIFSVPNICPAAGSRYSLAVTVNYTEPGQVFSGPYQSTGTVAGSVSSTDLLSEVGSFNGASFINIPSPPDFGTNSMSVAVWVYMKNLSSNNRDKISGNNYGGNNDFYLDVLSNDQIQFYLNIGGNWRPVPGGTFSLNKWNFVVGVYNGSFINVYLNGVLEAYTSETGTLSSPPGYLSIGATSSGDGPYYGYIANEQIYNTYLSNAQIEQMYNAGINNPLILPGNAVDWWPINVTNSTGWTKDFVTDTYNGVLLNGVVLTSNYPTTGLP